MMNKIYVLSVMLRELVETISLMINYHDRQYFTEPGEGFAVLRRIIDRREKEYLAAKE